MPFSTNSELPTAVKERLTTKEQSQFRAVFNSVFDDTQDEGKAFAAANTAVSKVDWSAQFEITKTHDEQLVFGWLSVSVNKQGELIEDSQGDIIEPSELEKAAYDFTLFSRQAGEMHERIGIGKLVESMVFTVEKQTALGIPEGVLPIGWWVGFKVFDDETWAKVKSGELSAFSIGGRGQREVVDG